VSPTALVLAAGDGYLAAAYVVFAALLVAYVAIMAVKLGRLERSLDELEGDPGEPPR
jgi:hypothetical protein